MLIKVEHINIAGSPQVDPCPDEVSFPAGHDALLAVRHPKRSGRLNAPRALKAAPMNHPKHSLSHALLLAAVALSSVQHSPAIAASGVCDPKSFAPFQVISGTAETCATCLFPSYPYASSIDVAAYPTMDFTDRWIYFLGDVTVRQIYGEFAAIVHNAQVRQALTLRLLCNPGCSASAIQVQEAPLQGILERGCMLI